MKKNRASRKKVNVEKRKPSIEEPNKQQREIEYGVYEETLVKHFEQAALLSARLISPFKHRAGKADLFRGANLLKDIVDGHYRERHPLSVLLLDQEKAKIFPRLVIELYEFALKCANSVIWEFGTKEQMKECNESPCRDYRQSYSFSA